MGGGDHPDPQWPALGCPGSRSAARQVAAPGSREASEHGKAPRPTEGALLRIKLDELRSIRSISPGGSPKKGVNKEYNDFFLTFSEHFRVLKLRFLAFPEGPGGFRELREAGRNHFHLSWYLSVPGITSYDQEPYTKNL